jgi:hypothetical protein
VPLYAVMHAQHTPHLHPASFCWRSFHAGRAHFSCEPVALRRRTHDVMDTSATGVHKGPAVDSFSCCR